MINLWVCVCVQGGGSFLSQQMAKEIKSYRKLTIIIKARESNDFKFGGRWDQRACYTRSLVN